MEAEKKTQGNNDIQENYVQLKNENVVRFAIKDMDGKDTGEYLEFDLEDIEIPLRYQDMLEEDKNKSEIKSNIIPENNIKDLKVKTHELNIDTTNVNNKLENSEMNTKE